MTKWNVQLMHYSLTLQQKFLDALWRNIADSERIEYQVFWVFAPSCLPPELGIPSLASWVEHKTDTDAKPEIFDRRKAQRAGTAANSSSTLLPTYLSECQSTTDDGFAKTAVAPLE
jgi:hypothetical protein